MGAWGTGPRDSDQAVNWLYDVANDINIRLRTLMSRFDKEPDFYAHELRAGADIFERVDLGFIATDAVGDLMRERLERLLNSDWPNQWDNPDEIRAELEHQIAYFKGERASGD